MNAWTRACTAALQTATVSMKLANTPAAVTRVMKRATKNALVCDDSFLALCSLSINCINDWISLVGVAFKLKTSVAQMCNQICNI